MASICKGRFLIVRLSKVYGLECGDKTLIDDIAQTLMQGNLLRAATDQIFCPTFIDDVVDHLMAAQAARMTGIINLCAPEAWSRFAVACACAEALQINKKNIIPIALGDLKEPFKRPQNTSMQPTRIPSANNFMSVREAIGKYAALMMETSSPK